MSIKQSLIWYVNKLDLVLIWSVNKVVFLIYLFVIVKLQYHSNSVTLKVSQEMIIKIHREAHIMSIPELARLVKETETTTVTL